MKAHCAKCLTIYYRHKIVINSTGDLKSNYSELLLILINEGSKCANPQTTQVTPS